MTMHRESAAEPASVQAESAEEGAEMTELPPQSHEEPPEVALVRREPSRLVAWILIAISVLWIIRSFL